MLLYEHSRVMIVLGAFAERTLRTFGLFMAAPPGFLTLASLC